MKRITSIWILGSPDPEMSMIESLLREAGKTVVYALRDGVRVTPGTAYQGDCPDMVRSHGGRIYMVECELRAIVGDDRIVRIDHHREGDPGRGKSPGEFIAGSSIGQVCGILGIPISAEIRLCAAADHCLTAAYRGECPGVDPDALMSWRVRSRAAFQGIDEKTLLEKINETRSALRNADWICLLPRQGHCGCGACGCGARSYGSGDQGASTRYGSGDCCCDMRHEPPYPELVEAAAREGIPYISGPLRTPDGREKYTVSGGSAVVKAFFSFAPCHGIVDCYGDPERGFAGGYAVKEDSK